MSDNNEQVPGKTAIKFLDPNELVIVTDPTHPLFDERGEWAENTTLTADIEKDGFISTIEVVKGQDPSGQKSGSVYLVVAGRQRVKSAIAGGLETIPCVYLGEEGSFTLADLAALVLKENERRQDDDTLAKAIKAKRLLDMKLEESRPATQLEGEDEWAPTKFQYKEALAFVAQVFGLAPRRMENLLRITTDGTKELRQMIKKGIISPKLAIALAELKPSEQIKAAERINVLASKRPDSSEGGKKVKAKVSAAEGEEIIRGSKKLKLTREQLSAVAIYRNTPREVKIFCRYLLGEYATDGIPVEANYITKIVDSSLAKDEEE